MKKNEAEEFLEFMVDKKKKLFPDEIQAHGTMTMYMLKEKNYSIKAFDYSSIIIGAEI